MGNEMDMEDGGKETFFDVEDGDEKTVEVRLSDVMRINNNNAAMLQRVLWPWFNQKRGKLGGKERGGCGAWRWWWPCEEISEEKDRKSLKRMATSTKNFQEVVKFS